MNLIHTKSMLEIKHLRTLKQIRHTGSLSEAAPLLHITQSALSHQIRAIEAIVGASILERKTRPLQFTSIGLRLLQLADDVIPAFEGMMLNIQREVSGESGRLSIAVECHSCFAWLLPTLEKYRQRHPDVEQDLTMVHSFNAIDALRQRQIDVNPKQRCPFFCKAKVSLLVISNIYLVVICSKDDQCWVCIELW